MLEKTKKKGKGEMKETGISKNKKADGTGVSYILYFGSQFCLQSYLCSYLELTQRESVE